jgi:hypothetical protein
MLSVAASYIAASVSLALSFSKRLLAVRRYEAPSIGLLSNTSPQYHLPASSSIRLFSRLLRFLGGRSSLGFASNAVSASFSMDSSWRSAIIWSDSALRIRKASDAKFSAHQTKSEPDSPAWRLLRPSMLTHDRFYFLV